MVSALVEVAGFGCLVAFCLVVWVPAVLVVAAAFLFVLGQALRKVDR